MLLTSFDFSFSSDFLLTEVKTTLSPFCISTCTSLSLVAKRQRSSGFSVPPAFRNVIPIWIQMQSLQENDEICILAEKLRFLQCTID